MKKTLLFSAMAVAMLGMSATAQAETAYGMMSGWPTWSVCSYDFAQLGEVQAAKSFDVPFTDVQSGASLGEYYYTYAVIADPVTYVDNLVFASVNMTNQETVVVHEFGDVWGENGFIIRDLAAKNGELYGIKDNNQWDDATETMVYATDLVKIDVANGSYETVATLDAVCWGLTCKDDDLYVVVRGSMLGWSYLVDLCKVEADYSLTAVTANVDVTTYEIAPSHAALAEDGNIYFFAGPVAILMSADGVKTIGEVTAYQSYAGTTFTASTLSAGAAAGGDDPDEKPATRLLTTVSSFGDFMGLTKDDQLSSQKNYFYNDKLQIVAVVVTAASVNSDVLETQYYSPYVYDAEGKLLVMDHYQYGLYDYGDRAMHQAAGVVEYKYDAEGNCIEEVEGPNSIRYEYDAEGHRVKEIHYSNGEVGRTLTFANFEAGKNKPGIVVSTHTNDSFTGEFYEETREYDAKGHLIKAVRLCNRDYVEDHGFWQLSTAAGDFMQEEHWTYDGSQLMLYEKFTNMDEETGELIPYLKTVYTMKDENTIGVQSYTAFAGEWYKSGLYQEETYSDFAGMVEATAFQLLSVNRAATGVNDAELEFTVPQIANFNPNLAFRVYRNGDLVGTVDLMDVILGQSPDVVINNESGNLVYTDRNVVSGKYDYFLQVLTADGGPEGGIDPLDEGEGTAVTYMGYCASNIVAVDLTLDLPAATNVNIIASEKDENNLNNVTIGFTSPKAPAEYGFISNELIVGLSQIGEDRTEDPEVGELHCAMFDDVATVCILTRYQFGKAVSEKVSIDVNSIPSSIEQVRQQGNVMIFDLNGRQVNAPLESLHGSFIILNGKVAQKIVLD